MSSQKNETNEVNSIKKETPSHQIQKPSSKKTFHQLTNFIENEMQLQANYQLVMLKVLSAQGKMHKAAIAEELAYYNNKDTSDVSVVKKFLNVPVYDVLVKTGFVRKSIDQVGTTYYEFNVDLNEYNQIDLLDLLERKIDEYNKEHGIYIDLYSDKGSIDWQEHPELVHVTLESEEGRPKYWLWSVTPENWTILQMYNVWGSKVVKEKISERVKDGDTVVFYVLGTGAFKGIFKFIGEWYDAPTTLWFDEAGTIIYKSQIRLKPIKLGTLDVYESAEKLKTFQNKDVRRINLTLKSTGGYPSNNGKTIPESDFNTIKNMIKPETYIDLQIKQTPIQPLSSKDELGLIKTKIKVEPYEEGIQITRRGILKLGAILTNDELTKLFGVGNMGGIRYSKNTDVIILCDSLSDYYEDEIDEGTGLIIYTGEGPVGKQEFTGGNQKIRDSKDSQILYFKEVLGNKDTNKKEALGKKYRFIGKVHHLRHHFADTIDKNGNSGKVIKFELMIDQ